MRLNAIWRLLIGSWTYRSIEEFDQGGFPRRFAVSISPETVRIVHSISDPNVEPSNSCRNYGFTDTHAEVMLAPRLRFRACIRLVYVSRLCVQASTTLQAVSVFWKPASLVLSRTSIPLYSGDSRVCNRTRSEVLDERIAYWRSGERLRVTVGSFTSIVVTAKLLLSLPLVQYTCIVCYPLHPYPSFPRPVCRTTRSFASSAATSNATQGLSTTSTPISQYVYSTPTTYVRETPKVAASTTVSGISALLWWWGETETSIHRNSIQGVSAFKG